MNSFVLVLLLGVLSFTLQAKNNYSSSINISADKVFIDQKKGINTYIGDAQIIVDNSQVFKADEIKLIFIQKELAKITAIGNKNKPASYQQNNKNNPIKAQALEIVYLIKKQFVSMKGKANLSKQDNYISGDIIEYDIKNDLASIRKLNQEKAVIKINQP
jgi:lipopolysaccharide transport protein LptA